VAYRWESTIQNATLIVEQWRIAGSNSVSIWTVKQWPAVATQSSDQQLVLTPFGHLMARIEFLLSLLTCALINYSARSAVGRGSSVGIATRYGLDVPGIESHWRRDIPHPSRPVLVPTQWVPGLSWGVNQPRCGDDHPPSSSAEVKERVELYLYSLSLSGPSWSVLCNIYLYPFPLLVAQTIGIGVEILYGYFILFNVLIWYEEIKLPWQCYVPSWSVNVK
jgi:hypothetical protein